MSMSPKDELFDNEEHPEPNNKSRAYRVLAPRPDPLHGLRQQPEQGRPDEGSRGEAHEVGQHAQPGLLGEQQEQPGERGTRDAAERGKQDDPTQERQRGLCLLLG